MDVRRFSHLMLIEEQLKDLKSKINLGQDDRSTSTLNENGSTDKTIILNNPFMKNQPSLENSAPNLGDLVANPNSLVLSMILRIIAQKIDFQKNQN